MRFRALSTDESTLAEIGARVERTRLERNLTQRALATEAGVSKNTIERLESGKGITLTNFVRVLRALGLLEGMEALVPEPLPSPIEALKLEGKRRQRASTRARSAGSPRDWTWESGTPDSESS